jgi:hypothetical protein
MSCIGLDVEAMLIIVLVAFSLRKVTDREDDLGREILRCARAVLDQHRLADPGGQPLGQDARHQIAVGAGRQRHQDANLCGHQFTTAAEFASDTA